ncbi:MAG: hypothetical protein AAFR89_08235 [Cyanobacteria bacterium J06633_1]
MSGIFLSFLSPSGSSNQNTESIAYPSLDKSKYYTYPSANKPLNRSDGGYQDNIYFNSIPLPASTLESLSCYVHSGAGTGRFLRMGLYDALDGLPANLLAEGEIEVTSNGVQSVNLNVPIASGEYFLCYTASYTFTIRASHQNDIALTGYLVGVDSPDDDFHTGLRFERSYSNLPQIFNKNDYIQKNCYRSPLIFCKFV